MPLMLASSRKHQLANYDLKLVCVSQLGAVFAIANLRLRAGQSCLVSV